MILGSLSSPAPRRNVRRSFTPGSRIKPSRPGMNTRFFSRFVYIIFPRGNKALSS